MKVILQYPSTLWYRYKTFVEDAVGNQVTYELKDIHYWREKLLINCILYSIPVSFLALVPSIIILINTGHQFLPVFDVFILLSITILAFNKQTPLIYRKAAIVVMLYVLSVTLIASLGSFGIGSIYLLALSVFISLLYCPKAVYWSVIANTFIYAGFAGVIYFELFNSPLIGKYSFDFWVAYSCNFLFLNIAVVIQIRHVINGLENTIAQEASLRKDLEFEITERIHRTKQLVDSEGHYKSLFYANPSPMWIFDADTLQFLQVNEAAVQKYGYREDEFLAMGIKDIRSRQQVEKLDDILNGIKQSVTSAQNTVVHRSKKGEEFYVEVKCNPIPFKGKDARLAIVRDISAQIQHIQAIEKQNLKLQQIAFMQSHIVRAPLCRILGLADLIMKNKENGVDYEMMEYLDMSVKELDDVVKTIIQTTDTSDFVTEKVN